MNNMPEIKDPLGIWQTLRGSFHVLLSHWQPINISTPNNLSYLLIHNKLPRHSLQLKYSFITFTIQRLDGLFCPGNP